MSRIKKHSLYPFYNSDYLTPTFNEYTLYLMAGLILKTMCLSLVLIQAMETALFY